MVLRRTLTHKPRIKARPIQASRSTVYAYSERPQQAISLKQLLDFGRNPTEEVMLHSAAWLWGEIPNRLARQVVSLDRMPYGLCLMPSIRQVREQYAKSFHEMIDVAEPVTYSDVKAFNTVVDRAYERHGGIFSQVARGIFELRKTVAKEDRLESFLQFADVTENLDQFYTNRMGIRMLLGQHSALMRQFAEGLVPESTGRVGLIDQRCSPAMVAQDAIDAALAMCRDSFGYAPEVEIVGVTDLTFPYVADHLFYMLLELLKNSLRATVEFYDEDVPLPNVTVVIAHSEDNEDVAIKVADKGGGIPRSDVPQIFSYLYTTADIDPEQMIGDSLDHGASSPLAGLGYGLPISRQYARYFGGDLQVVSMEGYGTDAYLHVRRLGDVEEPLN